MRNLRKGDSRIVLTPGPLGGKEVGPQRIGASQRRKNLDPEARLGSYKAHLTLGHSRKYPLSYSSPFDNRKLSH